MDLVIFIVALVSFALLAARFGHDSRPELYSRSELFRREGFTVSGDTFPDVPVAVSPRRQADWRHWYRLAHS